MLQARFRTGRWGRGGGPGRLEGWGIKASHPGTKVLGQRKILRMTLGSDVESLGLGSCPSQLFLPKVRKSFSLAQAMSGSRAIPGLGTWPKSSFLLRPTF